MKNLIIIIFLIQSGFLFSQDTLSMSAVESRQVKSMSQVNGKYSNGEYRYFSPDSNEPFTGILYARHDNGNYSSRQEFKDGIGQEKWINYYENGNLKEVGTYEQNRVEGPIKKYYENGQLKSEGQYKDWRIKVGKWIYFDDDGAISKVEDYGTKGNIDEVNEYYSRGEISERWYRQILRTNGFK